MGTKSQHDELYQSSLILFNKRAFKLLIFRKTETQWTKMEPKVVKEYKNLG